VDNIPLTTNLTAPSGLENALYTGIALTQHYRQTDR